MKRVRATISRWTGRWLIALLLVTGLVLGPSKGAVHAQDDENLEAVVAELVDQIAELQADLEAVQAEVDALKERVDEGSPGTASIAGSVPTEWVLRDASAVALCDKPGLCASKYDWADLIFHPDGTYTWEEPYAEGTYEVLTRGTGGNLVFVLSGKNGLECTANYHADVAWLEVVMASCPGFIVESRFEPGEMQELDSGTLNYVPEV